MTKDILAQYCDLREEVKDLHKRIVKTEDDIRKIEEEGEVTDSVKGGCGGIQSFKITGFPVPEYSKKRSLLLVRKAKLKSLEYDLLELTNEIEEYISSLDDSRIRRILRFRYIDDMTWAKVAVNMGGYTTEESVRKEHDRFLERN